MLQRPSVLFGFAIGTTDFSLMALRDALQELLGDDGWSNRRDTSKPIDSIWVRFADYGPHAGRWAFLDPWPSHELSVARRLAAHLQTAVTVHQATVWDQEVKFSDGEIGFRSELRTVEVLPNGSVADLEWLSPIEDNAYWGGDLFETLGSLLSEVIQLGHDYESQGGAHLDLYRVKRAEPTPEQARLHDLIRIVREAGAFRLVEVAGQRMIQVVLPSGTKQMSAVSQAELTAIAEATKIQPK